MATLSADGTALADDAGELALYHTPAHGQWTVSTNDGLVDRPNTSRFKATFLWLGQNVSGSNKLDNAVRLRFVTYVDPNDPDRMIGFIQPHFFSPFSPGFATNGIVNVVPASPTDTFTSNHLPLFDPLQPLPAGCTTPLSSGTCLGTYHFVVRRIKEQ